MKLVLCLFLLLGLYRSQAHEEYIYRHEYIRGINTDRESQMHRGLKDNNRDLSNLNHEEYIERPCRKFEIDCIRKYFAHKAKCTPVYGPVPDPFYRKDTSMNIPFANITYSIYDSQITGLSNGKITEFYVNKKSNILVFAMEFKKIILWCPITVVTYHRKGKEPIKVKDFSIFETQNLAMTLTIEDVNDIKLKNAQVFTSVSEKTQLIAGAGLEDISHKDLSPRSLIWKDNITMAAREAFVSQAPDYILTYLETNICDF